MRLARLFWIVAGANVAFLLILISRVVSGPTGRYDGIILVFMLVVLALGGATMGIVALIRRPAAYVIGLALSAVSAAYFGTLLAGSFVATITQPTLLEAEDYFTQPGDQALARAIYRGNAAVVEASLPSVNVNATGLHDMTFLRLALTSGDRNPDVVALLLRAGANPRHDYDALLGTGYVGDQPLMRLRDERLLRLVLDTGVDVNRKDQQGQPLFFVALAWPEGLAIMLDHGADIELTQRDGNTAIMQAVSNSDWPAVEMLLARSARLDPVNRDGKTVHGLVVEQLERRRSSSAPSDLSRIMAIEERVRPR